MRIEKTAVYHLHSLMNITEMFKSNVSGTCRTCVDDEKSIQNFSRKS